MLATKSTIQKPNMKREEKKVIELTEKYSSSPSQTTIFGSLVFLETSNDSANSCHCLNPTKTNMKSRFADAAAFRSFTNPLDLSSVSSSKIVRITFLSSSFSNLRVSSVMGKASGSKLCLI